LPSGWFPDPHGRHEHRWFNGTAWTADVSDAGQRFIDPLGAGPAGPAYLGAPVKQGNGPATAAMTCGLIAVTIAWIPFLAFVGIVLAIVAVWMGVVGLRRSRRVDRGRTFAITGLVTGTLAMALSVLGVVLTVSAWRVLIDYLEPGPTDAVVLSCDLEPGALVITGTITNTDDQAHDYTLYGVVSEPEGVDDIVLEVDDVAAGETRDVELRRSLVRSGECEARLVVHGPLPWGVEMERVNE
jgi:Protein of unknown function (DUF2510)